jgi:hypothetical protein
MDNRYFFFVKGMRWKKKSQREHEEQDAPQETEHARSRFAAGFLFEKHHRAEAHQASGTSFGAAKSTA